MNVRSFFSLTLCCLPLAFFAMVGCKKNDTPIKPTATIENLKVAHACEFKRARWYGEAAVEAEHERLGNLAMMFKALSRSEEIHASLHEGLLKAKGESTDTSKAACPPLGTWRQALKMAGSLERTEIEGLYPAMAKSAEQEHWLEAAQQFTSVRQADSDHAAMIAQAAERSGTVPIQTYEICTTCGKVLLNNEAACPVCKGTTFEKL